MIQYSHGAVVDCGVDGAVLTQDAADQLCVVFIAVRVDVEGFDNCLVHSVVFPLRVTEETEEGDGGEFRACRERGRGCRWWGSFFVEILSRSRALRDPPATPIKSPTKNPAKKTAAPTMIVIPTLIMVIAPTPLFSPCRTPAAYPHPSALRMQH